MTNGPEHFLIVSLGSIGQRHLRNLRRLRPQSQIGVWRLNTPPGETPVEGADRQFTTLEQVLDFAPRAAIIAGPASTHLTVAFPLATAGIHLLVEKPLSDHLEGIAELITLCCERGVTLMTGYNLRFLPSLRVAKSCLAEGKIGQVLGVRAEVGQYLPDWRPGNDYRLGVSAQRALGGGALLELSHELDYIGWLFGTPTRVTARGGHYSNLCLDVEDMVELILEYSTHPRLVNVHLDMLQRTPHRTCRFIGSAGTLVWDGIADRIEIYQVITGTWETLKVPTLTDRNQMYLDELSHFLECAERGTRPLSNGADGYRALAMIAAARQSMAQKNCVEVIGGVL